MITSISSAAADANLDKSQEFSQIVLEAHCTQSRRPARIIVYVIWTLIVVCIAYRQEIPNGLICGWVLFSAIVIIFRILLAKRLPKFTNLTLTRKMQWAVWLTLVVMVVTTGPILYLRAMTEIELAVVTFWLGSTVAATSSASAGWRAPFLVYLWTIMPILLIIWIPVTFDETAILRFAVSTGILLYAFIVNGINRDILRLFRLSFDTNLQLQRALDDAEEASRAKTRFLASASHDLRQPLHTLALFTGAISLQPLPDQSRELICQMDKALRSLGAQLNSLLDISKLDADVIHPNFCDTELLLILQIIGTEFEPLAAQKKLNLVISCASDLIVRTDSVLLGRIIRNLVDNALKYTQSGSVRIHAEGRGNEVDLSIIDTGAGIPISEHKRIFEEFYQVGNPERDSSQGLGLGLSIVSRLAKLMSVPISLRSTVGVGTELTLRLPRTFSVVARPRVATKLVATSNSLEGINVMVVDDVLDIRIALSKLIESMGGQVCTSSNSKDAIAVAASHQPDIMLCDLRLRGQDSGLQTIAALREVGFDFPVVIISGDTAPERLREAHDAGARLVHKPVSAELLCDEIFLALSKDPEAPQIISTQPYS